MVHDLLCRGKSSPPAVSTPGAQPARRVSVRRAAPAASRSGPRPTRGLDFRSALQYASAGARAAQVAAQEPQLADGPGRRILNTACTTCHGLREVTKFNGFYSRPQWRDIVLTMVDYGAPVGPKDVDVLSDYLTEQLGKKP